MSISEKLEKQLLNIQGSIQKKYGKDSITYFGSTEVMEMPRFTSNCRSLDRALGGGFPEGRIIELFGPPSSGKSTTCLHAIAAMQAKYPEIPVAYLDSEFSFDAIYAKALGVNVDGILIAQPDNGNLTFDIMIDLIEAGVKLIICDSVAALLPKEEDEASLTENQMGVQARLMSKGLRKLNAYAGKAGCTIIFTNQTRQKIGVMYGDNTVTAGGNALPFYASVRCRFTPTSLFTEGDEGKTARRIRVSIVKNKTYVPFKDCEFDIKFGCGFDESAMIIDEMFSLGIATKAGSWVSLLGEKAGQGRDRIVEIVNKYDALSFFDNAITCLDNKTKTIDDIKNDWEEYKSTHSVDDVSEKEQLIDDKSLENQNKSVIDLLVKSKNESNEDESGEV